MEKYGYRFSFGPWNISEGADPFGPEVRSPIPFEKKLKIYQELGYDAVQFHDDDAVPDLDHLSLITNRRAGASIANVLDDHGPASRVRRASLVGTFKYHRWGIYRQRPCRTRLRPRSNQEVRRYSRCPGYRSDGIVAGARRHLYA
jgi:hypothetical protein